jgi:hypothetical protein
MKQYRFVAVFLQAWWVFLPNRLVEKTYFYVAYLCIPIISSGGELMSHQTTAIEGVLSADKLLRKRLARPDAALANNPATVLRGQTVCG